MYKSCARRQGSGLGFFLFSGIWEGNPARSYALELPAGWVYAIELHFPITYRINLAAGSHGTVPEALEARFQFVFGTKRELFYAG